MNTNLPTQTQNDFSIDIPSVSSRNTDRQVYNPNTWLDKKDTDQLYQAADSGQREVFDTSMVGSLLKHVSDDTMVDEHLEDLTKAMDRFGRMLLSFYWHQEAFKDRYGAADLPELEDALRNAFEAVSDCLLFLREKSVQPYPEEDTSDVDLGPVSRM